MLFRSSVLGSREYLEQSSAFKDVGIPISYFNYNHPVYPQLFGKFLTHMSVIDILFNCGSKSIDLIKNGVEVEV